MSGQGTIEHVQHHHMARNQRRDAIAGWVYYDVHWWECTCGHVTNRYRKPASAIAARDKHALQGQTSWDFTPDAPR